MDYAMYVVIGLLVFIAIRNIRKDRADGRGFLGGDKPKGNIRPH